MNISFVIQQSSVQNKVFHFLPFIWYIFTVTLRGTLLVCEIHEAMKHSHRCPHTKKHEIILCNCYTLPAFITLLGNTRLQECVLNNVT